jgi:hypothetical protein
MEKLFHRIIPKVLSKNLSTGAPALTPQYNSDLFAKAGVV